MKKVVSVFACSVLLAGVVLLPAWAGPYERGMQRYEQGDYALAAQYLRAAISESPEQGRNPNIRYYLADTYLKLNRLAEAQAEYQTVLSLAPHSQAARLSKVALQRLQNYVHEPAGNRWRPVGGFNLPGTAGVAADSYTGSLDEDGPDYLDDVLENGRVVRWSLSRMPLKIYVERSPVGIRNFQPAFVNLALRAIEPWAAALNHQLSYEPVNSPELADIRITWVNTIDTRGHHEDGGTAYTAGLTQPHTKDNRLQYMDVKLATFDIAGKPQTEQILSAVAVHELGHALGLLGHSSHASDLMSTSNKSLTKPGTRDINTLRKLYRMPADISNLGPSELAATPKRQQELAAKLQEGIAKSEALVKRDGTALNWLNLSVNYYLMARQLETDGKPRTEVDAWYQKALEANNQAIQKEPRDPRAYHKRSLIYQELSDYNNALRDIETSLSLDRKEPTYHMLHAWYLAKLGQAARARASLDTYLLYRPGEAGSDDVKRILEALKHP